uniref:hypothetical protein n=1 Tax=Herbidospora sakaeratensis TaxID=564415 RepID=UPI0012F90C44|nr:hypothetical protein [Herbidospora sakaeratensis]
MSDSLPTLKQGVDLPSDVALQLRNIGPDLRGHQVLLLPTESRGGATYYKPDEMDAGRIARQVSLDASYLHEGQERRYLHEYSAGWVLDFAMAVGQNISADSLIAIGRYILARARVSTSKGVTNGPPEAVPTRVTIGHIRASSDGTVELDNLSFEGSADGVAKAIREVFSPRVVSSTARRESIEMSIEGSDSGPEIDSVAL